MPIELIPLQFDHIDKIQLRDSDLANRNLLYGLFEIQEYSISFTGIDEKENILGIGGFVWNEEENEAEGFLAITDQVLHRPFAFCKIIKTELKKFIKEHPTIRTIKAYVDNQYVYERHDWLDKLGFKEYRGMMDGWGIFAMRCN